MNRIARGVLVALCVVGGVAASIGCAGSSGARPTKEIAAPSNPFGIVSVGTVPAGISKITDRIWSVAARVRHLTPKAPVKLQALQPAKLVDIVRVKVKEEVPADLIRAQGRCFETLGLVPKGFDYEAETYAVLEEELAGMYVPEDKTMYVAIGVADDELDGTLSHELVHALQDQYFDLGAKMKFKPEASDALGALHALAEGDATSAMIDEMIIAKKGENALSSLSAVDLPDSTPEEFLAQALEDKKPDAAIRKAPRFIALDLVATYADGLAFVNGLRRRSGWDAVDMAWQKPPTSTEQLLHLDKYDAQEPSIEVAATTGASLGAGWSKTYDDVFGEAEARLAFGEWMPAASARRAAAGWGGDHVTMFETTSGDHAVAWRIVFDDEKEATEASSIVEVAWTNTFGPPNTSSSGGVDVSVFGTLLLAGKSGSKPLVVTPKKPGALPPLPDPNPPTTNASPPTSSGAATTANGCRAVARRGTTVAILAGVPCGSTAALGAETLK